MTPLERHIRLMSGFAARQAKQEDLAPLMEMGVAPGQRAFVYRNSGTLACVEALRSNYQRVETLMGPGPFGDMARAFVERHPATRRSLVGYGEALPDFIAENESTHAMAWLADLARLDRAWLEAHLAGDSAALGAADIQHLGEGELMGTEFAPHASFRLVETPFDVGDLWKGLAAGQPPEGQVLIREATSAHLFWRPQGEVMDKAVSPAWAAFFATLSARQPLGRACEAALACDPAADLSAIIAFTFQSGVLGAHKSHGGSET